MPESLKDLDKNKNGRIDPEERGASSDTASSFFEMEGIPDIGALPANRGAALLPYHVSDSSVLGGLTFEDQSIGGSVLQAAGVGGPQRVGVRYYEQDGLMPVSWTREERARLQRAMFNIGLYGNDKVQLGSWSARDQAVFAALLTYANVEGRIWQEQLAHWQRRPPTELLEQIAAAQPKKPTIRVTNPLDIRLAAGNVAADAVGGGVPDFVAAAAPGYQAQERLAQQGVVADQEMGGGGTVTDAPSMESYLLDKLRREKPIDVAGHSFVKAFDVFAQMMRGGL